MTNVEKKWFSVAMNNNIVLIKNIIRMEIQILLSRGRTIHLPYYHYIFNLFRYVSFFSRSYAVFKYSINFAQLLVSSLLFPPNVTAVTEELIRDLLDLLSCEIKLISLRVVLGKKYIIK